MKWGTNKIHLRNIIRSLTAKDSTSLVWKHAAGHGLQTVLSISHSQNLPNRKSIVMFFSHIRSIPSSVRCCFNGTEWEAGLANTELEGWGSKRPWPNLRHCLSATKSLEIDCSGPRFDCDKKVKVIPVLNELSITPWRCMGGVDV
jgi:hypothetical protein